MRRPECAHKVSGAKHGAKRTTQDSDPAEQGHAQIKLFQCYEFESTQRGLQTK